MARKLRPDPDQATFGFTRGGQLQMFRVLPLPAVKLQDGKRCRTVTPRDLYDVLRVIDDHGNKCWPSLETIAAEARMSRSTVALTIRALMQLDLLCVEKVWRTAGGASNEYTINWQTIRSLCHAKPPESTVRPADWHRPPSGLPQSAQRTRIAQEPPNEPPPPTPSTKTAARQDSWRAVEEEFRGQLSIARLIDWAAARGYTPQTLALELRQALQTARLPPNAQRLKSPEGAAVAFLQNGRWPVEGIITAADSERLARDAAERERARREFLEREAALDRQIAAERAAAKSQAAKSQASNALEASV